MYTGDQHTVCIAPLFTLNNEIIFMETAINIIQVKVKESLYRPGVAQRVPGDLDS
jgi:hypothetical protein